MNLFNVAENDEVLFEKNSFVIIKGRKSLIVWNRLIPYSEGHTHLYNLKRAKQLIYCAIAEKLPPKTDRRFEESYNRIVIEGDN